jgi:glycine oxidase
VKVLVLGSGAVGSSIAVSLSTHFRDVTVVERTNRRQDSAVLAAAGMVAPQCEFDAAHPLFELGLASRQLHAQWTERFALEHRRPTSFKPIGALQVAFDEATALALLQKVRSQQHLNLDAQFLESSALLRLEPTLSKRVVAGAYFVKDGALEPRLFIEALDQAMTAQGVQRRFGTIEALTENQGAITGARVDGTVVEADVTIVAMGSWSAFVDEPTKSLHSVAPIRGQAAEWLNLTSAPRCLIQSGPTYAVPRPDGRLVAGSTFERAGFDNVTTAQGLAQVEEQAVKLLPQLEAHRPHRTWSGLRPAIADGLPLVDWSGVKGLLFAVGHFRNGVLLAPLSAQRVLSLLRDEPTPSVSSSPWSRRTLQPVT